MYESACARLWLNSSGFVFRRSRRAIVKALFTRLFGQSPAKNQEMVIVQLNAKLQPVERGELFEDPLDEVLMKEGLGEVSGGGTMMSESGEILYCDIELLMTAVTEESIARLSSALESLGAPKGSKLTITSSGEVREIGKHEGLAVYLNGTDLPDETYKSCDSNFVFSEFDRLLQGKGRVVSYWNGPTETALYLYGRSFSEMRAAIADFIASYPLCQKCRITQIA